MTGFRKTIKRNKKQNKTRKNKKQKFHKNKSEQNQKGGNPIKVLYPINIQISIEQPLFQLPKDNNYYVIQIPNENMKIQDLSHTLKNDEILDTGNGIYTYIIGNEINDMGEEVIHLWCKKVLSVQEINTKHTHIIESSEKIFLKKQNGIPLTKEELHDGVIDSILYAGEIAVREGMHISANFLSGSYMLDVVDARNPSTYVIEDITQILKNILRINDDQITIDTTGKTYINNEDLPMTSELMMNYVCFGAHVYIFESKKNAKKYLEKPIALARLEGQYNIFKRMGNQEKTNSLFIEINNLKSEPDPPKVECI
jgi:hypothetical protein